MSVINQCWNVLNYNEISFDTKKNCGLITVYLFNFLPSTIVEKFVSDQKSITLKYNIKFLLGI